MARKPANFIAMTVGRDAAVDNETIYRVQIELSPFESVGILADYRLDYCCMPQQQDPTGGNWHLNAYASGAVVTALRAAGRAVDVLADAMAEGRRMQALLPKGDRFEGGRKGLTLVGKLI